MSSYKEFERYDKTYIVVNTTGFMVQGSHDYQEHHIVYQSDNYEDAIAEGRRLYPEDPSGWTYNSFTIHINTLTKLGKKLLEGFHKEADRVFKYAEEYSKYIMPNGCTMILQKNDLFDNPKSIKIPVESYRMTFLNFNKDE